MTFIREHLGYDKEECLLWPFARDKRFGRGFAYKDGKTVQAHREMCIAAHGPPPFEGACATHRCGKGHLGCVAPNHLKWATQKENAEDKYLHGTMPLGEDHPSSKLSAEQALRAFTDARPAKTVAEELGCSATAIRLIRKGKNWGWLTAELRGAA